MPMHRIARPVAALVCVLLFLTVSSESARSQQDASQQLRLTEIQAARACFEANLDAIRHRDRDAYLATYWHSETLARNGWGGVQRGYAGHAANAGDDDWPDVFDAQQMQLVWLRPGVVYGSYRYRVAYGTSESRGISERLFLKTADGWRIAVTTAFGAPEGTPPPPLALVGATLVDVTRRTVVATANVVIRAGRIACAGDPVSCPVPDDATVVDGGGRWVIPGLIDGGVFFARSSGIDASDEPLVAPLADPGPQAQQDPPAQQPGVWRTERQQGVRSRAEARLRAWLRCGVTAVVERGDAAWTWTLHGSSSTTRPAVTAASAPPMGEAMFVRTDTPAEAASALRSGARVFADVRDGVLDATWLQQAAGAGAFYSTSLAAVHHELRLIEALLERRAPTFDDRMGVVDSVTAASLAHIPSLQISTTDTRRLRRKRDLLQRRLEGLRVNLVAAHTAGVPLVLATGAGRPLSLHGTAVFDELQAWQRAGIPPIDILRAATLHAADAFPQLGDRGRLASGTVADLIVLEADPTSDIGNVRRMVAVVRGGELRWQREFADTTERP